MAKKKILQDSEGQIWPVTVADCVYLVDGSKTLKKYIDDSLAGKANSGHGNHVPTTQTANNATFLRNDNTWQKVTPGNIGAAVATTKAILDTSKTAEAIYAYDSNDTTVYDNLITLANSSATPLDTDNFTRHVTPEAIGAAKADHTHEFTGTSNLTLGTTSTTAFRGDYGNTAYQHSQTAHAPANAQKNSDITQAEIEAKLTGVIGSHHHDWNNIKSENTVVAVADDTTAKWGAESISTHWYSQPDCLNDQPNAWGFLHNFGYGTEVHQIWMTQPAGSMYHRGGNATGGWNNNTWKELLDSSNYSNYALPTSGGQMTGPIKFTADASSTDVTTPTQLAYGMLGAYGPLKVLANTDQNNHADDEYVHIAAGCGLNPESWDGIRVYGTYATSFGGFIDTTNESWVDLTGLDETYWYPVYCKTGIPRSKSMSRIACIVQLDSNSNPSWSTHQSGFTAILDLMTTGSNWGVADPVCIILNHQWKWTDGTNPIGYKQLNNSSAPCFYLKGGGRYRLTADYKNGGWEIVTSQVTIREETIKPENYNPGLQRWRGGIYADVYGTIGVTMELGNNISLCGKDTFGNNKDLIGVDSSNKIYLGWGNQADINIHNFTHFKDAWMMERSYGAFLVSMYSDPTRLEFVPQNFSTGEWDWENKCYMDNGGTFYAAKRITVAGHKFTPYSTNGLSIIRPDGQEFSGLEVKELWIGPYSGSTYRFTIGSSAPSSPSWGTVWVQL